ncbi:MAG: starch-binding protein [Bacteroidaceae bacterium]|nr:starch-binding protein [Bacteroidaceae bacterium]
MQTLRPLLPLLLTASLLACGDDEPISPTPEPTPTPTDTIPATPTEPEQPETPAQTVVGWPADYGGVMLQAFYWDGYADASWQRLTAQADDFSPFFSLVWVPQSGNCGSQSMGYDDLYWFDHNSSFGTEADLRTMISTFRAKDIGTIADVVINHRRNVSNWVDFPAETYGGVTYQMQASDICANDDNGATATWAAQNGYTLSSANDTGEGWDGMRDLDHTSANVQTCVKAYLDYLLSDLGYTGFRYDMVKGYSGTYTKLYNESAQPQFSVGECWDGTQTIANWIDATGKTSAAFDFQFRYTVRNAVNNGNWARLAQTNDGNWPLIATRYNNGAYRQWAVTFVENHDTERRPNAEQDPIRRDTLAANAYLIASPGTPCVFLKHWKAYKHDIARMIQARQLAGVTNTSAQTQLRSADTYYAAATTGKNGRLAVWLGDQSLAAESLSGYTRILAGQNYSYWVDDALATAWQALPQPTFASDNVKKKDITIYLKDPGWPDVYFYAWDGNLYIEDQWPGTNVTATRTIGGTTYYYRTFSVADDSTYSMNIIFSQGNGKPQTIDITGITADSYYEIAATGDDGKFTVNKITP